MAAAGLLRSQRNQVYEAIKGKEIEPSDFHWTEVNGSWRITHQPTNYYFAFGTYYDGQSTRWTISYLPDVSMAIEGHDVLDTWEEVLAIFNVWVFIVGREHAEPDYWEVSQQEKKLIAEQIDDIENSPFSAAELVRISSAISELREHLITGSVYSESQSQFITTRLKHLEDASHRLGRRDWVTLAMGTFTNIVIGAALTPDAARELLRMASALLGWIMGSIHLLP